MHQQSKGRLLAFAGALALAGAAQAATGTGWAEFTASQVNGKDSVAMQDCGGVGKVAGVTVHRSDFKPVPVDPAKQAACRAKAAGMTGRLPSRDFALAKLGADRAYLVQAPDTSKFIAEDAKAYTAPYRYGVEVATPGLRFARGKPSHGELKQLPDGRWLWRTEVVSPGAVSVEFAFSQLKLPEGAELFITNPQGDVVRGPIRASEVQADGRYYSALVPGDTAVLQLAMSPQALSQVRVEVANIGHAYRGVMEALRGAKSGSCNVDAICPLGDQYRDQIDSVGHYTLRNGSSTFVCSGQLIANSRNDTTPYFLTANHCLSTEAVADTVVVYWNFLSSTCRTPGSAASGTPLPRSISTHNQSGSALIANSAASDFALLRLDASVPTDSNPFWSGWDVTGIAPSYVVTIHHPAGDEMRISDSRQTVTPAAYLGAPNSGTTHWRIPDWDNGTTEGGSSGSGLWNQDKRLIGQLHGGNALCGNDLDDFYGRLSVSWNGGGTPTSRLRDWLDPTNSGASTLNGNRASGGGGGGGGGGTADEPSLTNILLPIPNPPNASCPAGFFITAINDGPGASVTPGIFGTEILLNAPGTRELQGGINFGGLMDVGQVGFAGFNFANPANENQRFMLSLTGSSASSQSVPLPVRVKILRQTSATTSTTVFDSTATININTPSTAEITVPPGFYVATVETTGGGQVGGSPEGQFFLGLATSFVGRPGGAFQGGAVIGGYHATHPFGGVSGFAAFCLGSQHNSTMKVYSAPTYGVTGARDLQIRVLDANQNQLFAQPTTGGGGGGGGGNPGQLQNGSAVAGTVNSTTPNGDFDEYTVVIPAGATNLRIETTGANADLDLYVRFGAAPTLSTYDCRPFLTGGNETCTAASPTVGTYFVRVYGFDTGPQNYSIRATWTP